MDARKTITGLVAVLAIASLLLLTHHSQRVLETGLPPREECASQTDALSRANAYRAEHGGEIIGVLGTGSMQPYIPAAPAGSDPRATVVAYVITRAGATFDDITPGALCTYHPAFDAKGHYIHGAALEDGDGWIMSGLHNARSESWARVTRENFTGIAAIAFVWTQ